MTSKLSNCEIVEGAPFEYYTIEQAEKAFTLAKKIIDHVKEKLGDV